MSLKRSLMLSAVVLVMLSVGVYAETLNEVVQGTEVQGTPTQSTQVLGAQVQSTEVQGTQSQSPSSVPSTSVPSTPVSVPQETPAFKTVPIETPTNMDHTFIRFDVGLQWLADTDMGIGFGFGAGSKTFGLDVAHFGMQPTLYNFGTVEWNQNRIGIYYIPWEFLSLQVGMHNTVLNLSADKQEVLGSKRSANWSGLYAVISFPIRMEKTYFIRPFYGAMMIDDNKRMANQWGIALGADFDTQDQKVLF